MDTAVTGTWGVVQKCRVEKHTRGQTFSFSRCLLHTRSRLTGAPSQTSLRQLTRLVAEAAAAADRRCARPRGSDPRAAFLARRTRGSECTRARLARGSHAPHPTRLGSQLQCHCPDGNVPRAWAARAPASCGARVPARRRRAPTPIFCDAAHEPPRHKGTLSARPWGHGRRGRQFGGYRLELQHTWEAGLLRGCPIGSGAARRRFRRGPHAQPTHAHGVMRHGTPLA